MPSFMVGKCTVRSFGYRVPRVHSLGSSTSAVTEHPPPRWRCRNDPGPAQRVTNDDVVVAQPQLGAGRGNYSRTHARALASERPLFGPRRTNPYGFPLSI